MSKFYNLMESIREDSIIGKAKSKGYGSPKLFHGSNALVYSDEDRLKWFNTNGERGATFFTNNIDIAHQYGEMVYEVYVSTGKSLVIDCKGSSWSNISEESEILEGSELLGREEDIKRDRDTDILNKLFGNMDSGMRSKVLGEGTIKDFKTISSRETDGIAKYARKIGFDSVVFKNVKDMPVGDESIYKTVVSDVYAIFKPSNIKSSRVEELDDEGVVIPMTSRFDSTTSDIRY